MLPEYQEGGHAHGKSQHINEGEEWTSYQQTEGEFEVVEEHMVWMLICFQRNRYRSMKIAKNASLGAPPCSDCSEMKHPVVSFRDNDR